MPIQRVAQHCCRSVELSADHLIKTGAGFFHASTIIVGALVATLDECGAESLQPVTNITASRSQARTRTGDRAWHPGGAPVPIPVQRMPASVRRRTLLCVMRPALTTGLRSAHRCLLERVLGIADASLASLART